MRHGPTDGQLILVMALAEWAGGLSKKWPAWAGLSRGWRPFAASVQPELYAPPPATLNGVTFA